MSIIEQAERLEAIGAGIQLSPNASRVLIDLGLGERLTPYVVAPRALNVMNARSGRVLARAPLGDAPRKRYGAPYLGDPSRRPAHGAARSDRSGSARSHCSSACASRISRSTTTASRSAAARATQPIETHGSALIGADGLWSALRGRLGHGTRAALCAAHRLARAGPGGRGAAGVPRADGQSVARPACASRALSGARRQPHQRGRDRARRLARDRLERRRRPRRDYRPLPRRDVARAGARPDRRRRSNGRNGRCTIAGRSSAGARVR